MWLLAATWLSVLSYAVALGEDSRTPLEQASVLREAGRFDEALDLLRGESRRIKEAEGDDSLRLLPVNDLAAEILTDKDALEDATRLLEKTVAIRQKLVDAGDREQAMGLFQSLVTLARVQTAAKRVSDAIGTTRRGLLVVDEVGIPRSEWMAAGREAIEAAVTAAESVVGPADEVTIAAREQAAVTFASLGMFNEAIEQRRRIVVGLASRGDSARKDLPGATARLCRMLMTAGLAAEATTVLEAAVAASASGESPENIETQRLLGEARLALGRLSSADASFARVLELTGGAQDAPTPANACDWLRRLLVGTRRGSADPLPDWFGSIVKTAVKSGPAEAATAAATLAAAGEVLVARDEATAALEPFAEALRIAAAAQTPSPEVVADLAGRLAAAQIRAGDVQAARAVAEPALAAAERALGPGAAAVGFLRIVLADALCRSGDAAGAAALAGAALARGLPRPDDLWEEYVAGVIDRLASATGDGDWRARFVAARASQFGEKHPHVAMAWTLLGVDRLVVGDWPAAARYLANAIAMQPEGLGGDDPNSAANLALLAHAERAAGDPARAATTAARALAEWERIAGPRHPGTLAAAEVLVSARLQARDSTQVMELLQRLGAAATNQVRQAGYLVRLAGLTATTDKAGTERSLQAAFGLACWNGDADLSAAEVERLAYTAARASRAYAAIGDTTKGEEALRKARSLAMRTQDSRRILERIEQLVANEAGVSASN